MPSARVGAHNEAIRRQTPRFRVILGIAVFGLEGQTTHVLEASVVRLGDGPRRIVNRGAGDCDGRFVVGRLNQMVSIHRDMTNAPTRHSPGTHDLLSKAA